MMRKNILMTLFFITSMLLNAEENIIPAQIESSLRELMPNELMKFKDSYKKNYSQEDIKAIMGLLKNLENEYLKENDVKKKKEFEMTYSFIWGMLFLETGMNTKDRKLHEETIKIWNNALNNPDTRLAGLQIAALDLPQKETRDYFNDKVWELFNKTQDKYIVAAVCLVVYNIGTDEDYEKIKIKKNELDKSLIVLTKTYRESGRALGILANCCNWCNYKKRKNENKLTPWEEGGLPCFGPRMSELLSEEKVEDAKRKEFRLIKIRKGNSENKADWVIQFTQWQDNKNKEKFMRVGENADDNFEIVDILPIENTSDKYRVKLLNKRTLEEKYIE